MAMRSLTDKHVMITGASSGIGRAAASAIARKGATVILLARREPELADAVAEIRTAGGRAHGYPCDITDPAEVDRVVAAILHDHGQVDMLGTNAGRSIRRSVYRSTDRLHDFERTMAVNYLGAVQLILRLLPSMRQRRSGHIVNISSAGVQLSTPRFSAYLASKAALDKFTDCVAAETLADGITFTTIHMPLVRTPMIAPSAGTNVGGAQSPEWAAATIVRALTEQPKRIDTPVGTISEYLGLLTPRLKDRALHRYYRAFPDSPAAKGEVPARAVAAESSPVAAPPNGDSHAGPARITPIRIRRVGRWIPGVHW